MHASKRWMSGGVAVLLALSAWNVAAQPPLEEEIINPSAVVFENGRAYVDADGGLQALKTRQHGGETIYYRMVRYDAQDGYVIGDGTSAKLAGLEGAAPLMPETRQLTPMRYYGAGHLYRPDFYNSPYNRDARQRYWGPGYFGSCSRYDGCREVQIVPVYPSAYPYRVGY